MKILAAALALFGPPAEVEAAMTQAGHEPQCAAYASKVHAALPGSTIETVTVDGQLHAYVRAGEWIVESGRLCGPSRVCLADDGLHGLDQ